MQKVTVVDLETTGLSPEQGDKIIEIGAIKLLGNKVSGVFKTLVNPERKIPSHITSITSITDEMVKNSPTIAQVLPLFLYFAEDDTLVMHNAKFDSSFLRYNMKHLGITKEFNCFCTFLASKKVFKCSNFRLATLKNALNLKTIASMHRAMSDTFVTAQLYLKLVKQLGIDTYSLFEKDVLSLLNAMEPDDIFVKNPNISDKL